MSDPYAELSDLKAWLNINDNVNNDDAVLTNLLSAATGLIIRYLGWDLTTQAYTQTFNGNGRDRVMLSNYPITAVSSVTIDGVAIPVAGPYGGSNFLPQGYSFDENTVYLRGYWFRKDIQNVTISYTAGYEEIPFEVSQACLELAADRYRQRDRIGKASEGLAGQTTAFSLKDMPPNTRQILDMYRKVTPT